VGLAAAQGTAGGASVMQRGEHAGFHGNKMGQNGGFMDQKTMTSGGFMWFFGF